jgi:hypothetical protein
MDATEEFDALAESHETLLHSYMGSAMADQAVLASVIAVLAASGKPEDVAKRLAAMREAATSFLQTPLNDAGMPEELKKIIRARVDSTYSFASKFIIS